MKKSYLFVFLLSIIGQTISAQNSSALVRNHFEDISNSNISKSSSSLTDFSEWRITDEVPSLKPGITHVYVNQLYNGVPIVDGTYKMTVKNNQITYEIDQFIREVKSKVVSAKSSSSEISAINAVIRAHNLPAANGMSKTVSKSSNSKSVEYRNSGITADNEPIKVKQVYKLYNGKLHLCWNVNLYEQGGENWWDSYVDITTGKIIYENNWVVKCNFDNSDHKSHNHESVLFDTKKMVTVAEAPTAAVAPDSYNVYPMPEESPIHGSRSIVTNPANTTASPYGWHDTNGSNGAEYTITRGNNVLAQDDINGDNGSGSSPNGGSSLDFNFPLNLNQDPSNYRDAAITNLFYWNNIMHDVWYLYGFNEASGNFQQNNYGKGGRGNDFVYADAQDGGGINNANFATPTDGRNPRMQMFLWDKTNPKRDGDLDNGIIAHEYGHGISTRLVGGPSSNSLGGSEQMGEGWSDWFGLMLTMKAGDVGTNGRGIGTYALGQPTSGAGIRPTKYSTDRSINDTDYADINNLRVPHGVGYAFATILWDMTWLLVDQEGFDPDFYNGTGGNNIAMALVIEGLKNTANNPGFVSGRDGILQADKDLYNEKYKCLIWKAFAARGVGKDANENTNGGSNTNTDQKVSFVNPCDGTNPPDGDKCSGDVTSFPFSESFEANLGQWKQATSGDDIDWTRQSNGTPSNGTGPAGAVDGTYYLYVEASTQGQGYPSKKAILNSPCLNFSNVTSPSLTFQYHMIGDSVGTLTVEARMDNTGNWTSVFTKTGAQGTGWNAADVDLSAYAGKASVQLRFNVVTGTSWQGDISIDKVSIQNGTTTPPNGCTALDFNDYQITAFATQDRAGDFSIQNAGAGLSLQNNTWKYISLNYTVTTNTVIEFEFSSTSEGEIHGVGFENDNALTSSRYFKVHGTQNYGVTNFDNYTSGTKKYVIPVGDFYTGSMDRLVFINDNDAGSGNTSIFSNVKIYEGSCNGVAPSEIAARFGKMTPTLGNEDENGLSSIRISPNPLDKGNLLKVTIPNGKLLDTSYSITNIMGQVVGKGTLNTNGNIDVNRLETGMYMLTIQNSETKTVKRFIVK
ncbi:M36 family metallopeptidase [Aquimarina longa]|uniref:M36 family metallopeptidase n=1 Tax=Aquimarina longa TaxID=1080221 RepID=UPI00130D981E|nr:M36 family metallopeptidase [Aquimarina longa]